VGAGNTWSPTGTSLEILLDEDCDPTSRTRELHGLKITHLQLALEADAVFICDAVNALGKNVCPEIVGDFKEGRPIFESRKRGRAGGQFAMC